MPVSVKFGAEVSNEATAELERAVRALSRAVTPEPVTVERVDHGPQNVVEWFLPPLAVISFVAGTAGSMILKGFLKEMERKRSASSSPAASRACSPGPPNSATGTRRPSSRP